MLEGKLRTAPQGKEEAYVTNEAVTNCCRRSGLLFSIWKSHAIPGHRANCLGGLHASWGTWRHLLSSAPRRPCLYPLYKLVEALATASVRCVSTHVPREGAQLVFCYLRSMCILLTQQPRCTPVCHGHYGLWHVCLAAPQLLPLPHGGSLSRTSAWCMLHATVLLLHMLRLIRASVQGLCTWHCDSHRSMLFAMRCHARLTHAQQPKLPASRARNTCRSGSAGSASAGSIRAAMCAAWFRQTWKRV